MESNGDIHAYSREIVDAVAKAAGTFNKRPVNIITAEVMSVSADNRMCNVETILSESTITINDVNLSAEQNDGVIEFPAIGATVIIAMLQGGENYVLRGSDIDRWLCFIDNGNSVVFDSGGWIWNGGTNGGIGKTAVEAARFNIMESKLNEMVAAIISINTAGSGSPATPVTNATLAAFFAPFLPALLSLTTQAQISDTKIQH